ncbi:neutral cholesterol ester hydrolase 1 [Chanos chanos]|uniref:Neutral cholesterol ester hydrolase 1 n=1 Tax=Chanos chanos TaxID=29144 RepID=A0A6J2UV38_CHACN|nr:neutral cholesterol ester hydrolase 1-like [Chanos chanos]
MRPIVVATVILTVVAAYYVYRPLPNTLSDRWKFMFLDAIFRGFTRLGNLAYELGLSQDVFILNHLMSRFGMLNPQSSESVRVTDTTFAGLPARVFESTSKGEGHHLKRGVVYFHGGGWTLGSGKMQPYDLQCRMMAEKLDAVIVSVDYRLAPEARFPTQFNDALQASKQILKMEVLAQYMIDPYRVAVSGDSAGGNLAAAVAQQMAMDETVPIKFKVQALIYPALQALDFNTPSYQQNGNIPILYRPHMALFWLRYLNGDERLIPSLLVNNHTSLDQGHAAAEARAKVDWTHLLPTAFHKDYKLVAPAHGTPGLIEELPGLLDVRAAPLLAEREVLKAVPPAYILTCEHDVLRDDGLMYWQRLEEAGVAVTHDYYEDGFHGCMFFAFGPTRFSVGVRSLQNYIQWLDKNL